MTGSNHTVAGALIAMTVTQPAAAIPLAVASHFVMDALPHYGDNNKSSWLNRHFNYVLAVDGLVMTVFLLGILFAQPANWALIFLCAVLAVLPDVIWLPYYIADLKGELRLHGKFARFSKWIQWGGAPLGYIY